VHRRPSLPLAALAAIALAAGGCSGLGSSDILPADEAATVNGEAIANDFFEEISTAAASTLPDEATDEERIALQRQTLGRMIETEIISQFAEDNGATLDDAAIDTIVEDGGEELVTAADTTGLSPEQYAEVFVAPDYLLNEVTKAVAADIEVTDEQLQERLDSGVEGVTATLSHILVESEDEATAALERINGGEDFAAVAADVSIDGSKEQGGSLGQDVPLSGFVPEFAQAAAEAPIGEPVGPVQSEFGFHLILVEDRTEPDLAAMEEDLRVQIALESEEGQAAMAPLVESFTTLFEDAEVEVSSRYGVWDAANRTVVDPEALVEETGSGAPTGGTPPVGTEVPPTGTEAPTAPAPTESAPSPAAS